MNHVIAQIFVIAIILTAAVCCYVSVVIGKEEKASKYDRPDAKDD